MEPQTPAPAGAVLLPLSADIKSATVLETSIASQQSLSSTQPFSSPQSLTSAQSFTSSQSFVSSTSFSSVTTLTPTQSPILPKFKENYVADTDRQKAVELCTQQRVKDGKTKKTKKEAPFDYKEVNPVLNELVSSKPSPASPGLVQALLELGGDVSVARPKSKSIWKKVLRKDQNERRSDVLAKATQNCSLDIVWILTLSADDIAKTEALKFAIMQNDTAKALVLLNGGADADEFHDDFKAAVQENRDDMVEVLLRATKGPCATCRTISLVKAASNGNLRNSLILLEKGADADFDNGAAMQKAIDAGREDLANAIASCGRKPSPGSFDIAVGLAYSKLAHDAKKQHHMIDICLRGGAKGSITDETLVQACKKGQNALINILLTHGASVDHGTGSAIQYAISSKQPALLTTLLRGKPSMSTLATAIPLTTTLDDPAIAYEITDILLSAGLRGESVAKTLITIVERPTQAVVDPEHLKLIQLVLENGEANVNFNGGKSISVAAAAGITEVLKLLLQHKPSVESLNKAFPLAMELQDPARRLEIVAMVLQAGAAGEIIDDALLASAGTGKNGVALTSVLLKQSSVDYRNGKALCNAISSCCLEQMQALMAGGPSASTLSAAWTEADALQDDTFQYKAFQILLAVGVDQTLKDKSLNTAATRGQRGMQVCTLLLQHQASPDYSNGECVVSAAKGFHLDTLHLLAGSITSGSVFTTAFDAFSEGDEWLTPRGLEIVHFLLEYGASGQEVDAAFCKAARLYDADALNLLASSINPEVVNVALVTVTQAGKDWLSINNDKLWLIHSLLEWGAAGDSLNLVFLEALDAYARGFTSEDLIDTLLHVGAKADANFQNGEAIQLAAKYGNVALLEKLTACGATKESLSIAFAEAITAGHDEMALLELIDVFMNNKSAQPDVKVAPNGYQPPLFACLAAYPQSANLVKRLIQIGCDLEAQIEYWPYDDEDLEGENVTVLGWALSQPEKRIASAVIEEIIAAKADLNFTTKITKVTPLILAAKYSRSDLVAKLLKQKAKATAKDLFERSALFYAARAGDLDSVNALLKAKSPVNDGSIQEAAKELHSDVVKALVKGKHHPDFPSSKEQHEGRTALQELCLICDGSKGSTKIEETIRALVDGKANPLERSRNKNALFLALDNANPVPVTRALLDCVMWKHMTSEENVYIETDPETGTKYYFSPTMYVSRGFSQGPESENEQLLKILIDKRGIDRFYAEGGAEQPLDACGMPQAIIDAEKKRTDREQKIREKELDHQLKLLHEKQAAELKAEIERAKHEEEMFRKEELAQQKLEQKENDHQQALAQELEKTNQKQGIMASTANLKLQLQERADAQKQRAIESRTKFEEMQKARMIAQKERALKQEQELKLRFTEQAKAQKLALQERQNQLAAAANQQKVLTAQRLAETHVRESRQKAAIKERQDTQALKLKRGTVNEKERVHEMQMKELRAKKENMKWKMLESYFTGKHKKVAGG